MKIKNSIIALTGFISAGLSVMYINYLPLFMFLFMFILTALNFNLFSSIMQGKLSKIWLIISIVIVCMFTVNIIRLGADSDKNEAVAEQKIEVSEVQSQPGTDLSKRHLDTPVSERLISFLGIFVLVFLSWLISFDRKKISWRPVIWGVGLQIILGIIVLSPQIDAVVKKIFGIGTGEFFFNVIDGAVRKLLAFSEEGAVFVFGKLAYGPADTRGMNQGMFFFFSVLTTIVFFSSIMTVLYHTGIMERIINFFASIMQKTMKTSGSETLSAAANIFVGQTEAPLVVKPFVEKMTVSELHAIMTGGFATVAGGVMAAYVMFLKDFIPNIAGHLVTASIMSAPAALAVSKIIYPETEESVTAGGLKMEIEKPDANLIEAGARGASEGMTLMLNVASMLIAFVAIIAMVNAGLELASDWSSYAVGKNPYKIFVKDNINKISSGDILNLNGSKFTVEKINTEKEFIIVSERIKKDMNSTSYFIERNGKKVFDGNIEYAETNLFFINLSIIFAWLFAPISWAMGVPWRECAVIGRLLGEKLVLTEFIAYLNLSDILRNGFTDSSGNISYLSQRSAVIASYALCGFANFASIGIQIGGIGGIAPKRRGDLARIGLRAMFAGAIAACMTGTIAGILL